MPSLPVPRQRYTATPRNCWRWTLTPRCRRIATIVQRVDAPVRCPPWLQRRPLFTIDPPCCCAPYHCHGGHRLAAHGTGPAGRRMAARAVAATAHQRKCFAGRPCAVAGALAQQDQALDEASDKLQLDAAFLAAVRRSDSAVLTQLLAQRGPFDEGLDDGLQRRVAAPAGFGQCAPGVGVAELPCWTATAWSGPVRAMPSAACVWWAGARHWCCPPRRLPLPGAPVLLVLGRDVGQTLEFGTRCGGHRDPAGSACMARSAAQHRCQPVAAGGTSAGAAWRAVP